MERTNQQKRIIEIYKRTRAYYAATKDACYVTGSHFIANLRGCALDATMGIDTQETLNNAWMYSYKVRFCLNNGLAPLA